MEIEPKTLLKCNICNYQWRSISNRIPRECPKCKRYDWNESKQNKK